MAHNKVGNSKIKVGISKIKVGNSNFKVGISKIKVGISKIKVGISKIKVGILRKKINNVALIHFRMYHISTTYPIFYDFGISIISLISMYIINVF
jgi:hypothetical protein